VDDLLASAAAMGDPPSCNYEGAGAVLQQAASLAPNDARVATLMGRVRALMGRRATALAHYQAAQGQLAGNDLAGALASARAARDIGPPCDRVQADGLVALIENALNRGRVADRRRADAESRAAAAAVLGDLISIYNQGAAAQGGAPPPAVPQPAGGRSAAGGVATQPYCSIQRASAPDEQGIYWAVISFSASAQVTNYLLMAFRQDGSTPEQWVATAGAQMGGAGRSQVRGRGSRQQMEALARQLCPNPATPPAGFGPR
jgi:hypothetical protein